MADEALSTREDFEYWLADMDCALDRFFEGPMNEIRPKLNFSPQSLDVVEQWILARYPTAQSMLAADQLMILDGLSRYVGETFRRSVGWKWDIRFDNPTDAYFGIPILSEGGNRATPEAPLTLATATANRRTGKYLRTVLERAIARKR